MFAYNLYDMLGNGWEDAVTLRPETGTYRMFGLPIQVFYWSGKGPSIALLLILLSTKASHMVVWYAWNIRLS